MTSTVCVVCGSPDVDNPQSRFYGPDPVCSGACALKRYGVPEFDARCDKHQWAEVRYAKIQHGGCPLCRSMRLEGAASKRVEELGHELRTAEGRIEALKGRVVELHKTIGGLEETVEKLSPPASRQPLYAHVSDIAGAFGVPGAAPRISATVQIPATVHERYYADAFCTRCGRRHEGPCPNDADPGAPEYKPATPPLVEGGLYRDTTKAREPIVEFAGIGATGLAIVHPPGEPDMQSSWAVHPSALHPIVRGRLCGGCQRKNAEEHACEGRGGPENLDWACAICSRGKAEDAEEAEDAEDDAEHLRAVIERRIEAEARRKTAELEDKYARVCADRKAAVEAAEAAEEDARKAREEAAELRGENAWLKGQNEQAVRDLKEALAARDEAEGKVGILSDIRNELEKKVFALEEKERLAGLGPPKTFAEAEASGYAVDRHAAGGTVAYKGPRFNPTEIVSLFEAEAAARRTARAEEIRALGAELRGLLDAARSHGVVDGLKGWLIWASRVEKGVLERLLALEKILEALG